MEATAGDYNTHAGLAEYGFKFFDHGAADIILAVAFNSSGTRIALGSADHKIRVYDIEQDRSWALVDQWRGHDAEVLDASLSDLYRSCFHMLNSIKRFNGLDLH